MATKRVERDCGGTVDNDIEVHDFLELRTSMATKRVKRVCGGTFDNETNNMAKDRISQLPDPVIHHIFLIPSHHLYRPNESSFQALETRVDFESFSKFRF